MKKIALTAIILALIGCQSEQEKIHTAQVETCKKQIQSGQEPTEFCLNLLPEYRSVARAQQQPLQQQPLQQYSPQQYAEQQPVVQQPAAPVIVNQPAAPAQNNGMTDMLVGGLIGHAIGSSGNNSQAAPVNNHYYDRPSAPRYVAPRYVERSTTIIKQQAPTPAPVAAPKKNYMDTSKLNSYGARPAAPAPRSSSMNMGKLSSYGKR